MQLLPIMGKWLISLEVTLPESFSVSASRTVWEEAVENLQLLLIQPLLLPKGRERHDEPVHVRTELLHCFVPRINCPF